VARFGGPLEPAGGTRADAGFSTTDPAERAHLMARFRTLPGPGVSSVFAIVAIGLGVRRRATADARHIIGCASINTQFKDPLC
jgi:hypothetical protein